MKNSIKFRKIKNKIGASIILGMLVLLTFSGTVAATAWDHQGNNNGEDGYLGNTDTYDLILITDNSQRMRIASGGNIGIGTDATPDAMLEIAVTGTTPFMISNGASGDGDFMLMDTNGRLGIGDTSPDFKLEVAGSSGSGYLGISSAANNDGDIFIIDSSGNVGIGTTTPGAKLDVEVSSGGAATIGNSGCSATGDYAVAMGRSTTASGDYSIATGQATTASGVYSTAMGEGSTASATNAFAIGWSAEASNLGSNAIGWDVEASGGLSTAIGTYVTASADNAFVIGRGPTLGTNLVNNIQSSLMVGFDSTTPTLFVNGSSVGIGTTSPDKKLEVQDSTNPQLRLTQSDAFYTDLQTTSSGYLYINPSGGRVGIGTASPGAALDVEVSSGGAATIGHYQNSATGDFAVAMGEWTTASGQASTAMGWRTTASGLYSFAVGGLDTEASNQFAIAMGLMAVASGYGSVAIGYDAEASGGLSHAIGTFVTASANNAFVIGRGVTLSYDHLVNNIPSSLMVGFDSTTPTLFVDGSSVGIGTTSPDNLLDIEKQGTAKSNLDIFHITNSVNATDMDGTETSILFNQHYYDASTPDVADAGRITVGTETDWTSTASTQDGYMAFHTVEDGSVSEQVRITSGGKVGIGTLSPDTVLDINGAFTFREKSSDPSDPDEGSAVLWMSDGNGSGDDGDIMIKITAGGSTKTFTLVDFE